MKYNTLFYLFFSLLIFSSCSDPQVNQKEINPDLIKNNTEESEVYDFVFPQFLSLARSFQAAGLTFETGKTNSTDNYKRYTTQNHKLLNMGVYSTDLAYCALNKKNQDARDYFKVLQKLGNDVGLSAVFSEKSLIERFDEDFSDENKVQDIIFEIQEKTESYLQYNNLNHIALIQFTGAWIEGLYLGAENKSTLQDESISEAISNQMIMLKNIIKALQAYSKKDSIIEKLIVDLINIQNIYANFESVKNAGDNPNLSLPKLNAAEVLKLKEIISSIRNYITSSH